jgi:hypothetical protein
MHLLLQVAMRLVVLRLHRRLVARAVPPFHWTMGPGRVGVGQPMVNPMLMTDTINAMVQGVAVALPVRALKAMIGEPRVELRGHSHHHVPEELRGPQLVGVGMQLGIGTRTGAVDRAQEEALTCCCADLGTVAGAGADWRGLHPLLCRLLAGRLRYAAHTMPLQTTLEGRSGQVRACRVQGLEAVIQGQPQVAMKGHAEGGFRARQARRAALVRPPGGLMPRRACLPLYYCLGGYLIALGPLC